MFDLNAKDGSVQKKKYRSPIQEGEAPAKPLSAKALDEEKSMQIHHRLLDLYVRELDRQYENRVQMATDEDFYDSEQWREEDKQVLEARGQVPLVYNVISGVVDWVTGTEKRGRADFNVLPRRKEDGKPAERKTQLLKYLSDVNRTPFHRSRAFESAVKAGLGWLEDGIGDDDEGEPIYSRFENWRNILWDSAATEMDLSDSRYIFRSKWTDVDIAKAWFKSRTGLIQRSAVADGDGYFLDNFGDAVMDTAEIEATGGGFSARSDRVLGYERQRVRLIEGWFRMPGMVDRLSGGQFSGEIFDPYSPGHVDAVNAGEAEIVKRVGLRMCVAIFTQAGLLYLGPSPYRHNRFPFTPVWGKRRGRNGMPYGLIRALRGIQEDINKRASKALHILSTNKIIMDEGAVKDIDELAEEAARPDAIIVKAPGKELTLNAEREMPQYHVEMMARSIQMIQQVGGVTDEQMGRTTNAKSGVAIARRQEQGAMTTTLYFDNLRLAFQVQGEKQLSLTEQFMTERKAFRITDMRGKPDYLEVNDGLPENDIVRSKADFVISDADWRATMRQAQVESLLEVMSKFPPEVAVAILDLVVEEMDLINREEIVRRIRNMTGQRDPDAEEPTPEEQQRAAAAAKAAQFKEAIDMATLRKLIAEALKAEMEAQQAQASAVRSNIAAIGGPKRGAIDVAADLMTAPGIAPLADGIMREVGFVSKTETLEALAPGINQPPQQPEAMVPAPQLATAPAPQQ